MHVTCANTQYPYSNCTYLVPYAFNTFKQWHVSPWFKPFQIQHEYSLILTYHLKVNLLLSYNDSKPCNSLSLSIVLTHTKCTVTCSYMQNISWHTLCQCLSANKKEPKKQKQRPLLYLYLQQDYHLIWRPDCSKLPMLSQQDAIVNTGLIWGEPGNHFPGALGAT